MLFIRGRHLKKQSSRASSYVVKLVNFFFHFGDGGKTSSENDSFDQSKVPFQGFL
jgi:hypothetical protein